MGPFFQLDRLSGKVEFGATAHLVTRLNETPNLDMVRRWLSDERRVALSIWDENLIEECGDQGIFRLRTMSLQFVTIMLAPTVDVRMWTDVDIQDNPTFRLQSVAFDPNIQLLPGIGVSASSLGIHIEVVGVLQPTTDGKGVKGRIAFSTAGNLPPPMRLLPDAVLKTASDTINETITQFAIQSFQRGAIAKYREFVETTMTTMTKTTTATATTATSDDEKNGYQ